MNISTSTQSNTDSMQTQQVTVDKNVSANNSEKINSSKVEEKKEEKVSEKQGEFKKVLEEQKETDKVNAQPNLQEINPNLSLEEQIANKFSFDTTGVMKKLKTSMNYGTISISKDDAKFFADLVENKQFAIQQSGDKLALIKFADEIGPTYKAQQTSQVLTDLISKAYNEQKPVRIDFDNNVSVILKIDNKGKVSAEFIPGDKAVEAYLRNNIGYLKQRFDDQNLPYNDLLYRQSNQNNRDRRQNQQQKGE